MVIQTHKLFQCVTVLFVGHLSHQCPAGLRGNRWICSHLGFEETHLTSVDSISLIRIVTWLHLGAIGYAASGQLLPRLYTKVCVCVCAHVRVYACACSVVSNTLWPHRLLPSMFLCPWNSPDKITGVSCHFLLQWIFPIQGLNLWLLSILHWQANSLLLVLWHPTPVFLPGKSHGRRSLVGCSPWVSKSQTWLSDYPFTFHFHALEKEMATHSSVLAWRIPGMGESGGLLSLGSHRVGHDWSDLAAAAVLPGKPLHYGRWEWILMNCLLSLLQFLTKFFCSFTSH